MPITLDQLRYRCINAGTKLPMDATVERQKISKVQISLDKITGLSNEATAEFLAAAEKTISEVEEFVESL